MSSTWGSRAVTNILGFVRRKSMFRHNIAKFSVTTSRLSDESSKDVIPDPVPGMMQAAVLKTFSEPLIIENVQPPMTVGSNEVLIDVQYCALNGPDVLLMKNSYSTIPSLPQILGYEVAGKLRQVGDGASKKGFKVGDKVVALNKTNYGGLAEQCLADISDTWKIPSTVKTLDSVCLLKNYLTAYIGLTTHTNLEEGEMVLVNVGFGGIGLAAVDIAANIFRAQVIGVTLSEDRTTSVRDKGAFATLKYNDKKLVKKIEEFAAERNIKDVFIGTEGENLKKMINCFTSVYKDKYKMNLLRDDNFSVLVEHLSREGRLVIAGFALNKKDHEEDDSECPFTISGFDIQEYKKNDSESYRDAGTEILQYLEEGLLKPSYSLIAGFYKINDAVKYVSDLKSSEKVVIDFKNPNAEMVFKQS